MTSKNNHVPVVQKMDNIIHWKIAMQWIIVDKTYRTIHWKVIYLFLHLIVIPAEKKRFKVEQILIIHDCLSNNSVLSMKHGTHSLTSLILDNNKSVNEYNKLNLNFLPDLWANTCQCCMFGQLCKNEISDQRKFF